MKLADASGRIIENPTVDAIENEIRALPGGIDSFLILSRDEMTYVQTAGGGGEPFTLEYQDGSLEMHYRAIGDVTLESVIKVFQAYAHERASWRNVVQWEREDLAAYQRGSGAKVGMIAGLILVVAVVVYWWLSAV